MHYAVMSSVLTIRDVPDDVKAALVEQAKERGQSLQALLQSVLRRQAEFSRNERILDEIEQRLSRGGGASPDAPDAAELLAQERERRSLS